MPERDESAVTLTWLLGQATPEVSEQIENRMFADQTFYEQVRILEDDLIRDYLRGALALEEREAFERKFFSTQPLREKVEFLRSVMQASESVFGAGSPSAAPGLFRRRTTLLWAALAAALAVIVFQGWRMSTLNRSIESLKKSTGSLAAPRILASFALMPGVEREARRVQSASLNVPARDGDIQLTLVPGLQPWSGRSRVAIEKPEGGIIFSALSVPGPDGSLHVVAPAAPLMTGDYIVTADDANNGHATYEFRIVRQ